MRKINFDKFNNFMHKPKNTGKTIDVEFGEELNKDSIDTSSNYQDTDQIIELTEKTLKKHYSKNKK